MKQQLTKKFFAGYTLWLGGIILIDTHQVMAMMFFLLGVSSFLSDYSESK